MPIASVYIYTCIPIDRRCSDAKLFVVWVILDTLAVVSGGFYVFLLGYPSCAVHLSQKESAPFPAVIEYFFVSKLSIVCTRQDTYCSNDFMTITDFRTSTGFLTQGSFSKARRVSGSHESFTSSKNKSYTRKLLTSTGLSHKHGNFSKARESLIKLDFHASRERTLLVRPGAWGGLAKRCGTARQPYLKWHGGMSCTRSSGAGRCWKVSGLSHDPVEITRTFFDV